MEKASSTALAALAAAAFTLLAAVVPSGAQAEDAVRMEGLVDAFAGSMRLAGDPARETGLGNSGMSTTWWGVTGGEDLGNGYKAGFKFGSFFRPATGAFGRFDGDTFWARDANASLSGGFGTLTLGRRSAPNFLPTILFNPFGDSFTFSPLVLHANQNLFNGTNWSGTTPADTGWSNLVSYATPNIGGLTATLFYQFAHEGDSSNKRNIGINALYFNGPVGLTAFYERARSSNPTVAAYADASTRSDWMLGGSYDFSVVKVYATYGQARNDVSRAHLKSASLGASIPLGQGKVLAAYARTRNNGLDATRQTLTLGYDYKLSRRTDVYANVMHDKITAWKSGTSAGVGIRHRF